MNNAVISRCAKIISHLASGYSVDSITIQDLSYLIEEMTAAIPAGPFQTSDRAKLAYRLRVALGRLES